MKATIVVFLSLVLTVSLTVAKILPYEEDDLSRSEDSMETDTNDHIADFVRDVRRLLTNIRRRKARMTQMEDRQRPVGRIQKRHCWDVADVCCMWNIC